jgi:ACT domain-containing protein
MSESQRSLEEQIVEGVLRRLGRADQEVARAVAREVSETLPSLTSAPERVVITASGRNRRGIVLAVAQAIHDFGGDIRDISQTIVDDFFTMLVVIDIGNAVSRGSSLETLRGRLGIVSKELGVHIVAMHDDMLEAMHSV